MISLYCTGWFPAILPGTNAITINYQGCTIAGGAPVNLGSPPCSSTVAPICDNGVCDYAVTVENGILPWQAFISAQPTITRNCIEESGSGVVATGESYNYRYGFQGMDGDDDAFWGGVYMTEFRQYDAKLGRWFSVDPMWSHPSQLGTSPYSYCSNNPLLYVDRDGRLPVIVWAVIGGAVVGMVLDYSAQVGTKVTLGKTFRQANRDVDWMDVMISGAAGGLTAGTGNTGNVARITCRTMMVIAISESGKAIVDFKNNRDGELKFTAEPDALMKAPLNMAFAFLSIPMGTNLSPIVEGALEVAANSAQNYASDGFPGEKQWVSGFVAQRVQEMRKQEEARQARESAQAQKEMDEEFQQEIKSRMEENKKGNVMLRQTLPSPNTGRGGMAGAAARWGNDAPKPPMPKSTPPVNTPAPKPPTSPGGGAH